MSQGCKFLQVLARLRLGLSHLNEGRFNHNFENCIKPLWTDTLVVEPTAHFFYTDMTIKISAKPSKMILMRLIAKFQNSMKLL